MNALSLSPLSDEVLIWVVNVLLQVTLVTAIALTIAAFVRHSSTTRYWVLCVSLLLVLSTPGMALVMQLSGKGLLSVSLMHETVLPATDATAVQPPVDSQASIRDHSDQTSSTGAEVSTDGLDPFSVNDLTSPSRHDREPIAKVERTSASLSPASSTSSEDKGAIPTVSRQTSTRTGQWIRAIVTPLLLVWVLGTVFLLIKLIVNWCRLAALLRSASPVTNASLTEAFQQVGRELQLKRLPKLVSSQHVSGPISAGLFRPHVVLPEEMLSRVAPAPLRDLLVHEVAHIMRHDQAVVLLQNVASAIFWLHPLVKSLNRQLAQAREEVCDNYVLVATDAPSYSRTLLALAELCQAARPVPGAVGLFTSRWKLESRVAGLLDERRNRRVRLTTSGKTLVFCLALVMTTVAALGTLTLAVGQTDQNEANAGADQSEAGSAATDSNAAAPDADTKTIIRGTVVDPEGTPADGVTVYLPDDISAEVQTVVADRKGEFAVVFDKAKYKEPAWHAEPWRRANLFAVKEGYALGWLTGDQLAGNPHPTLRLHRDDVPIRGQILNLEGQPVPHATLHLHGVYEPYSGNLDELLKTLQESPTSLQSFCNREMRFFPGEQMKLRPERGTVEQLGKAEPIITADAEGRFEFRGVGRERLATLSFEGSNIQSSQIYVLTRGDLEDGWNRTAVDEQTRMMLESGAALPQVYAATFKHLAAPSVPIVGYVRDRDTGQPLKGIYVGGWLRNTSSHANATTDENGRYELTGLGVEGTFQQLDAGAKEDTTLPYLGAEKSDLTFSAASPLKAGSTDFELTRGIVVRGKVTDAETGRPVKARIEYIVQETNPHVEKLADPIWPYADAITTEGGEFVITVLPGPGTLGVSTSLSRDLPDRYRPAKPEDFGLPVGERGLIATSNLGLIRPEHYKAARFIDFKPADAPLELKLNVTPFIEIARVRCVDQQGQESGRVYVQGHLPISGNYTQLPRGGLEVGRAGDAYIEIAELGEVDRRPVVFLQRDKNIAAILYPDHSEFQPRLADLDLDPDGIHRLVLTPCASIAGQLVDADETPLANAQVTLYVALASDSQESGAAITELRTTDDGSFKFEHVPTGGRFSVVVGQHSSSPRVLKQNLQLIAGEVLDLGQFKASKAKEGTDRDAMNSAPDKVILPDASANPKQQASSKPETATSIIRGVIQNSDGKPANGAYVVVIGLEAIKNVLPVEELLAEGVTDAAGRYELTLRGVTSKTHVYPHLIAWTQQSGISWQRLDLDVDQAELNVTLQPQQLIRVRLVDIEGRPAAHLPVNLSTVTIAGPQGRVDPGFGSFQVDPAPRAWPVPTKTDDLGLLTITNIAPGHGVYLKIPGTDKFASQDLFLNTGMSETRGERDGTYRSLVKNMKPGEIATLPIAPAQIFEGVVLLGDSDKPAANARITMWASQQEPYGSMVSIDGKTDEAGRFRLNPYPGIRFGFIAYPPEGTPYQVRRLNDLHWSSGAASKNIEIRLDQGVLAQGTIVDAETGDPLRAASVQYYPDRINNKNLTDDIVTGWQSIQKTNDAGEFKITVLPGPGTLLVHATEGSYILQEVGSRELEQGKPGGARTYAHAFHKIDPIAGEPMKAIKIGLKPGGSVKGTLVDAKGNAIGHALVVSRLKILDHSPQWRGFPDEARNGRFEISGLRDGEEYPVYFLDPKNQLGASAMISTKNAAPTVVLEPCGSATARFVDPEGKPVASGLPLGLHMVVTPGKPKYDFQAILRGETVADEDDNSNIDRVNYWPGPTTNENGELTYPALIPGARYRFVNFVDGDPEVSKEFVAKSGEAYDMGEIEVNVE